MNGLLLALTIVIKLYISTEEKDHKLTPQTFTSVFLEATEYFTSTSHPLVPHDKMLFIKVLYAVEEEKIS